MSLLVNCMRLQESTGKKYKGKLYPKWHIVIPNNDIERLGWSKGMELVGIIAENIYIIKPRR